MITQSQNNRETKSAVHRTGISLSPFPSKTNQTHPSALQQRHSTANAKHTWTEQVTDKEANSETRQTLSLIGKTKNILSLSLGEQHLEWTKVGYHKFACANAFVGYESYLHIQIISQWKECASADEPAHLRTQQITAQEVVVKHWQIVFHASSTLSARYQPQAGFHGNKHQWGIKGSRRVLETLGYHRVSSRDN